MGNFFGVSMVVVSAVSFGVMPIFARYAYADGMNTATLLFLRFTIASLVMLGVMRKTGATFPRGRTFWGIAAMGGVGYVGQSFSYFTALNYASASLVALLLYVYPALVTVLSALFFKEHLTRRKIVALVLASAGTALIVGLGGAAKPLGIFFGLAAAVIYSLYIIAGSRIIPPGKDIPASTLIMISAALVYGGLTLAGGAKFPATPEGALAVLGIALISTAVAILTFFLGMRAVGPTKASMISTLEPVVTVIFASALLGETLTPLNAAGGVLVLAAVIILTRR
jgi:drug/metabolite transporter (DMT)-like permease